MPFTKAVSYKNATKYFKFLLLPAIVFLIGGFIAGFTAFTSSYTRVVQYNKAFVPPAPFSILINNKSLEVPMGSPFLLEVIVEGKALPETLQIQYNAQTYFLTQEDWNKWSYKFPPLSESVNFNLIAPKVSSSSYRLQVLKTPLIESISLNATPPAYTQVKPFKQQANGNILVPEGSQIEWDVKTSHTDSLYFLSNNISEVFNSQTPTFFRFKKRINNKLAYKLSTSNVNFSHFETLDFKVEVVKDKAPEITLTHNRDSIQNQLEFNGIASDDYQLKSLKLVYFETQNPKAVTEIPLPISNSLQSTFSLQWPGSLTLEDGLNYGVYFQATDNDAVNGNKTTTSQTFYYKTLTDDLRKEQALQTQKDVLQGINKELDKKKASQETLKEFVDKNKEKQALTWAQRNKLSDFLQKEKQTQEQLQKWFDKFSNENELPKDDALKERFEELQESLKSNENLLDSLQKWNDKLQQEDLLKQMETLQKANRTQEKSLEQLLALTKRFYVQEKAKQISDKLFKLGKQQESLADSLNQNGQKQKNINDAFDSLLKEQNEIQKENNTLDKPLDINKDSIGAAVVKKEQQQALDNISKQKNASKNQQKAGQRMQQMGSAMQQAASNMSAQSLEEDTKVLARILDNLLGFSFGQENLLDSMEEISFSTPRFTDFLRKQNQLSETFKHIDDSIFALSLRQSLIGKQINKELVEIDYQLDKATANFSENLFAQGAANQQFIMTGANTLANLLDNVMSQMQNQLMASKGQGDGQGQGFQLPDIIEQQQSLKESMEGKNQGKGQEGKPSQGQDGTQPGGQNPNGQGAGSQGQGYSDTLSEQHFELFKKQQDLRNQLETILKSKGLLNNDTANLLKSMKELERDLLNGRTNNSSSKHMANIIHKMLELDNALQEQEKDNKRSGETNTTSFKPTVLKELNFNTTKQALEEVLKRDNLHLNQALKNRVLLYFKNHEN